MEREKLIESLRCCADPSIEACRTCAFDKDGSRGCVSNLVSCAADMLEQDGIELEKVDGDKICNQLDKLIKKLDTIIKGEE